MYEFDKDDIRIVNILLGDGRMPASEIARHLGDLSERAIRYRIDKMLSEGVLQVSAIINPAAFGLTVKADVLIEVESDRILAVAKKLTEYENITYVACGIGENDISVQLVAKDTAEIYHFITDVIRKIAGVRKTTTSIVPIVLKDINQWRIPGESLEKHSEGSSASFRLIGVSIEPRWSKKPVVAKARSKSDPPGRKLEFSFLG